jgi:hypothetical protein
LRLNLAVPPTSPATQKRLSVLAGDPAGWPNGRRPNDDVTDIALRVVAGALLGPVPALGDLGSGLRGLHATLLRDQRFVRAARPASVALANGRQ